VRAGQGEVRIDDQCAEDPLFDAWTLSPDRGVERCLYLDEPVPRATTASGPNRT
jgi:hypothetical protein